MQESDITRIRELEVLVGEIEKSYAWQMAIKELKDKIAILDDSWHNAPQDKVFQLQVTKLAVCEIIEVVDEWRDELSELKKQLNDEQSPEGTQDGDFDSEVVEDDEPNNNQLS
jgi:hypothetical protein